MPRRHRPIVLLLLALISGGAAAMIALRYLRQQTTPLMATETPRTAVVVAARPLAVGAVVGERDVKTVAWSGSVVPAGFFGSTKQVVGRGLLVPVSENEPMLTSKLAASGAGGGLPVIIEQGMRAVSVAVDEVVGVAGFVLPSTRVDVLLTLSGNSSMKEPATRVIMQNVRTLAAGQSIQQDKEGKPQRVAVVTLLVSPEQAETLALAANQGRIQLALRNTMDTTQVHTTGTRVSALFTTAPVVVRTHRRAAPPPVVTEPNQTTVEVFRGGQRTLMRFER